MMRTVARQIMASWSRARRRYLMSQPIVRSATQRRFTTWKACGLVRFTI
jgi:hypothetical protein